MSVASLRSCWILRGCSVLQCCLSSGDLEGGSERCIFSEMVPNSHVLNLWLWAFSIPCQTRLTASNVPAWSELSSPLLVGDFQSFPIRGPSPLNLLGLLTGEETAPYLRTRPSYWAKMQDVERMCHLLCLHLSPHFWVLSQLLGRTSRRVRLPDNKSQMVEKFLCPTYCIFNDSGGFKRFLFIESHHPR